MTLAIHEQGGLTEAEIKLAIEESAERREAILDTKFASHRSEMREDLAQTNAKIEATNASVTAIQRELGELSSETSHQTELLQSIRDQGNAWHESDVAFRASVTTKLDKLETDHSTLADAVARLKWIGIVCFALGRVFQFIVGKVKDADFWKIAATLILVYILALLFPSAAHILQDLKKP